MKHEIMKHEIMNGYDCAYLKVNSNFRRAVVFGAVSTIAMVFSAVPAAAQIEPVIEGTEESSSLPAIVVTAQKRAQDSNSVPMSINVATADQLEAAGITQPRDLVKIVPSFNVTESIFGTPIFTLRGVGFADFSIAGRPTVGVYVDEVPIPFVLQTRGAQIDLERVEILKGPQGTLFGQNSTGGAINYIGAKPTRLFEAGANFSYGRFNAAEAGGFVSGPISETISARLAVEHSRMDDWQQSYSTSATNGSIDFTNIRMRLAWEPTPELSTLLTVGGFVDHSDTLQSQVIEIRPNVPSRESFLPELSSYPLAPETARAADFTPGEDYTRNNKLLYADFRADYEFANGFTLTSLSSFSKYDEDRLVDTDGMTLRNLDVITTGTIKSFSQELRLSSEFGDRGNWIVGVNYAQDDTIENEELRLPQSTIAYLFVPLGLPLLENTKVVNDQYSTTRAIFASMDYDLTDTVNVYGGIRYTKTKIDFEGCSFDPGNGVTGGIFGAIYDLTRAGDGLPLNPPIEPGGCFTADETSTPKLVVDDLDEDNVSWRAGLDWAPTSDFLMYANVSQGFKAGGFPTLTATVTAQLQPAVQESLRAYELGFKSRLLGDRLQINGAVFKYDYTDKQVLAQVNDAAFGTLLKLVNIPESEIVGFEFDFRWAPVHGLTLTSGISYIDSEIGEGFSGVNPFGDFTEFDGESFPNTPKWHLVGDANYERNLSIDIRGFAGVGFTYQSATNNSLGEIPILEINERLLIDLRAGISANDDSWRITVFGRNVTDDYYWTGTQPQTDTTNRFAGMPATYGIELVFRFD